ncbi:BTB POZ domain-containing protein [Rutstroemia sp. NJR-2017a BVV2]|nr:BTB POZ domain-containing protein [Rutstroemia sp. NJR-2017a BVV2]
MLTTRHLYGSVVVNIIVGIAMDQTPIIIDEAPIPMEKHIIDPDGDCFLLLQEKEKAEFTNVQASIAENDDDLIHEPIIIVAKHVQLQVSAKHLMLASPVFKAMLRDKDRFKEGEELHTTGTVRIDLPDDEPHPFVILMYAIHCQSALVPRDVQTETLYMLALQVDKYQMHNAVKLSSDMWIRNQKSLEDEPGIPECIADETVHTLSFETHLKNHLYWLCISWVFHHTLHFKRVTSNLTKGIEGDLLMEAERYKLMIIVPNSVIGRDPEIQFFIRIQVANTSLSPDR